MASIYSRSAIHLPNFNNLDERNRMKLRKLSKVLLILLIAIITLALLLKAINPIFRGKCVSKAYEIATIITNEQSSLELAKEDYSKLVTTVDDESGHKVLQIDVVSINRITSNIAIAVQRELSNLQNENISIPLGSLSSIDLIAGMGPDINIQIATGGKVITDLKSEFESVGINQTLHRIYMNLTCNATILTPFNSISSKIENQVLLVENVIMGDVPQTYYNLNDFKNENAYDLIQ